MGRCLLFLAAVLLTSGACPGADVDTSFPFPVSVNDKMGYIDASGKIVISPRFAFAADFSEGLAVVLEVGPGGKELHGYRDRLLMLVGEDLRCLSLAGFLKVIPRMDSQ